MTDFQLLELRDVPPDLYSLTFYAQGMRVGDLDYEVLFLPLGAGWFGYEESFRQEIAGLPDQTFEIKFALSKDIEEGGPNFHKPEDFGYPRFTRKQFGALGEGLMQSVRVFDKTIRPEAYVAVALDDRPQLSRYYDRLVTSYGGQIEELGYRFQGTMKGQGYAFLRI